MIDWLRRVVVEWLGEKWTVLGCEWTRESTELLPLLMCHCSLCSMHGSVWGCLPRIHFAPTIECNCFTLWWQAVYAQLMLAGRCNEKCWKIFSYFIPFGRCWLRWHLMMDNVDSHSVLQVRVRVGFSVLRKDERVSWTQKFIFEFIFIVAAVVHVIFISSS